MGASIHAKSRVIVAGHLRLVLAALVASLVTAQTQPENVPLTQYVRKSFQADAGLSESSVMSIAQTSNGFFWLGTETGLFRFDGLAFSRFDKRNTPALQTNTITALLSDHRGTLWIGTAGRGIILRTRDGFVRTPNLLTAAHDTITSLYEDQDGRVFAGTEGHGVIIVGGTETVRLTRQDGLPDETVTSIAGDRNGAVWVVTQGGLATIKAGRLVSQLKDSNTVIHDARCVLSDHNGALWIGTKHSGLYRWTQSSLLHFDSRDGLSSNSVSALFEDRSGALWVGSLDNGVSRYQDGTWQSLTSQNGFPGGGVWTILGDATGAIWLGGTETGLTTLRRGAITPYGKAEGLSSDTILGLHVDSKNRVWVSSDGGLDVWDHEKNVETYTTKDGLPDKLVFSTAEDENGTIWAGTRRGLAWLEGGRFNTLKIPAAPAFESAVLAVQSSRNGGIWAAGRGTLVYLQNGSIRIYSREDGIPDKAILCLFEDHANTLWLGTDGGGLLRLRDGRVTQWTSNDGLTSDTVFSILGDRDGTLWLGTRGGGLVRLAKGGFVAITPDSGLSDDDIFSIVDDDAGRLWFSSNRGIFYTTRSEAQAVANGERSTLNSVLYGITDGMRTRECNGGFQGTGLRTGQGDLWFPTMKGVARFLPAKLTEHNPPPAVVIEQVQAGDGRIVDKDQSELPVGIRNFEVRFISPELKDPDLVRYKYILQGFDTTWSRADKRRPATYTNVPPGEYTFRVIACLNGACTSSASTRKLIFPAVWYETRWFYATAALLFVVVVLGTSKLHFRQVRARERKLQLMVDDRTRQLRESHEQLETRVDERTRELSLANQSLQDEIVVRRTAEVKAAAASRAKSEFLTNMSHELRTPMNGVIGMTNLALGLSTDNAQREYLELASQSADHLLSVVNDILDFSKIEAGKLLLEELDFDLVELTQKLVRTLEPLAVKKSIALRLELAPGMPRLVRGDPTRLRQVLFNLLGNAIKFTAAGSVVLSVDTQGADGISFRVSDTGIGIAKHKQASIFESFVQGDGSTARKFGGTGLGLAISDRLVRLMGGVIHIESEEGKGSTFSFGVRLPCVSTLSRPEAAQTGRSEPGPLSSSRRPGRQLRILVAEDNAVNRRLAKALLAKAGYLVTVVEDGGSAIQAFGQSEYDLILMDIQMPGVDGLEATAAIRTQEAGGRRTPIIALTAHAMEGDRELCVAAGMDDYLTKPLDAARLATAVSALLPTEPIPSAA
jgi:signal transduction histidine kinase/ligand-binding sensor domain-containing protein/ActR/RegA family two-component response regulator